MALSGNSTKYNYNSGSYGTSKVPFSYLYSYFSWSGTQSVSGNYTDITVTFTVHTASITKVPASGNIVNVNAFGYTGTIAPITLNSSGDHTFGSTTIRVYHEADGSKSGTITAEWLCSPLTYSSKSITEVGSQTDSILLDTIPRADSISNQTLTINSTGRISWGTNSSSFTHTLTYAFGNASGTIGTGLGTYADFTPPTSLYAQIPNSRYGTGTLTLTTYSGGTQVGDSSTAYLYLYANDTACTPTFSSVSMVDTNSTTTALTGNSSTIVRNASTPKLTISALSKYYSPTNSLTLGSSSVSYSQSLSGENYVVSSENTVNTTDKTITIVDTRGYSSTYTVGNTYIDYFVPTINANFTRASATSSTISLTSLSGNVYTDSFGSTSNTIAVSYRYKIGSSGTYSDWASITVSASNNKYTSSSTPTIECDYKSDCYIQVRVVDKLNTITSDLVVTHGNPILYWTKDYVVINGDLTVTGTITHN